MKKMIPTTMREIPAALTARIDILGWYPVVGRGAFARRLFPCECDCRVYRESCRSSTQETNLAAGRSADTRRCCGQPLRSDPKLKVYSAFGHEPSAARGASGPGSLHSKDSGGAFCEMRKPLITRVDRQVTTTRRMQLPELCSSPNSALRSTRYPLPVTVPLGLRGYDGRALRPPGCRRFRNQSASVPDGKFSTLPTIS
jgi:hypothetical protein